MTIAEGERGQRPGSRICFSLLKRTLRMIESLIRQYLAILRRILSANSPARCRQLGARQTRRIGFEYELRDAIIEILYCPVSIDGLQSK
jgi:hypothetical protein